MTVTETPTIIEHEYKLGNMLLLEVVEYGETTVNQRTVHR